MITHAEVHQPCGMISFYPIREISDEEIERLHRGGSKIYYINGFDGTRKGQHVGKGDGTWQRLWGAQ